MIYGIALADRSLRRLLIAGFGILIVLGLVMAYVF